MALKIIDVSSYQDVTAVVTPGTQGVIVKATQGTNYVNPMCDLQYQLAKAHGMVLGLYHYLSGGDAKAEAAYFCANTEGYWKNDMVTMWADWESGQNASWGDGNYVAMFISEVNRIIGVDCCGLYTGLEGIKQCRNLADTTPLWFAGYPDLRDSWETPDFIYDVAPWKFVSMWQFTDSNGKLDRSIFYGEIDTWIKLSTKGGNPDQDPIPVPLPIPNDGHNVAARNLEDLASGISVESIQAANGIADPDQIFAGESLIIK